MLLRNFFLFYLTRRDIPLWVERGEGLKFNYAVFFLFFEKEGEKLFSLFRVAIVNIDVSLYLSSLPVKQTVIVGKSRNIRVS